jgi:hypothetical protein
MPSIDQRTRARTQVLARDVPNRAQFIEPEQAGKGFGALSSFLVDFGKGLRKADLEAQEKADESTLAALSVAVAGRENEVRDSIRSGDYSKWGVHQQMARSTFRRSAMEVFGESLAVSDKENYQTYLNQLEPGQDPMQATGDWVRLQTEGMDPMGAKKYLEVTEAYAGKMITARQKTLADQALKEGLDRIPLSVQAGLEANTFNSASDIEDWATKFGSSQSLGQNALKARSDAMDEMTKELLRIQSNTTDKAQLEKVTSILNSPTANGLPLYETIDRKGREAVLSEALAAARRPNSVRTEQLQAETKQRLQNIQTLGKAATFGDEPDSLMRLFQDYTSRYGKADGSEGTNTQYISTRGEILKAMVKDGTENEIAKTYLQTGSYAPGDGSKVMDQLVKMAHANPDQADLFLSTAAKVAVEEGPSKLFKDQLNKSLRGDIEGAMGTAALVRKMVQEGNLGYQQILGSDEDVQAYYISLVSSTSAPEAEQKMTLVRESLRDDGTFRGAYDRMWNFDNKARATKGKRGKRDFLIGFFKDLTEEETLALGYPEGTKFESLNPKYRRRMSDLLDLAALATTTGADNTEAQLTANLKLLTKNTGQIGWSVNADGKWTPEIGLRDSPLLVRNSQGRLMRAKGWGRAQAAAAEEYFMQDGYEAARELVQFGGVESDDRTTTHGDYSVTVTEAKVPVAWRTFSSSQGAPMALWDATLANVPFVQEMNRTDDVVAFKVLPPGERVFTNPDGTQSTVDVPKEFVLDNYMKYVWLEEDQEWSLRYRDGSINDLDGVNSVAGGVLGDPKTAKKVFEDIPESTEGMTDPMKVFKAGNLSGASQAELKAALEAYTGKMNPGTGEAPDGTEVPSQEAVEAKRRFMETYVDDTSKRGIYTGRASVRARDIYRRNAAQAKEALKEVFQGRREWEDLYGVSRDRGSLVSMWEQEDEEVVQMAEDLTKQDQFSMDPLGTPAQDTVMFKIADDLTVSEPFMGDQSGGRVGFNFNLGRPDAEDILDAAGAPTKKQLEEGASMDKGAATRVLQAALGTNMVSIKKQLQGVPLDSHQWEAVAKYSYGNPLVEQKRDPLHALAFRESSLRPDAINKKTKFVGLYQMGSMTLKDTGYIKNEASDSNSALNDPSNWTGKDGMNSLEDFLGDTNIQYKAITDMHKRNLRTLKRLGVLEHGDSDEHVRGMLFVAHLLGASGAKEWAETGEGEDQSGTKADEYYELGRRAEQHQPGQLPFELEDAIRKGNKGDVSWLMRKLQPIEQDDQKGFSAEVKGGQRGQYFLGASGSTSGVTMGTVATTLIRG